MFAGILERRNEISEITLVGTATCSDETPGDDIRHQRAASAWFSGVVVVVIVEGAMIATDLFVVVPRFVSRGRDLDVISHRHLRGERAPVRCTGPGR